MRPIEAGNVQFHKEVFSNREATVFILTLVLFKYSILRSKYKGHVSNVCIGFWYCR